MTFLQLKFWIFLSMLLLAYYILPKKIQWVCLLIGSYIFYCCSGIKNMIFILSTTITIWGGAVYINKIEDKKNFDLEELKKSENSSISKKEIKEIAKKNKKKVFWIILFLNFGVLAFLKYFNFTSENITSIFNIVSEKNLNQSN